MAKGSRGNGRTQAIFNGIAAEHEVASELNRRGYIATITSKNSPGIDILAANAQSKALVSIQVKSTKGRIASWVLSAKDESVAPRTHLYVLVRRGAGGEPLFHIVPSGKVSRFVKERFATFHASKRSDGRPKVRNSMRTFEDRNDAYLDAWDHLPG